MESGQRIEYIVPKLSQSIRLDKWLLDEGPNSGQSGQRILSRTQITKLIDSGDIRVNGAAVKKSYKAKSGDKVEIVVPEAKPDKIDILPIERPLTILYQDSDLAVIYKEPGLAVHRGEGENTDTAFLVNVLKHHFGEQLSVKGGEERPGIVHRLDKDTSGAMIVCKTDLAWEGVHEMLKERRDIDKQYHCIVLGRLKQPQGEIRLRILRHPKQGHKMITSEDPAVGKEAHTDYQVVEEFKVGNQFYTLLNVKIHTGRTHQIRVHVSSIQHPIVGDALYSSKSARFSLPYLLLVSKRLQFKHPITKESLQFDVDYPPHFEQFLRGLRQGSSNNNCDNGAGSKS